MTIERIPDHLVPSAPTNISWPEPVEPPIDELEDMLLEITQLYIESRETSQQQLINNIYQLIQNVPYEIKDPDIIAFKQCFSTIHPALFVKHLQEWFTMRLKSRDDQVEACSAFMTEDYLTQLRKKREYIKYILDNMIHLQIHHDIHQMSL